MTLNNHGTIQKSLYEQDYYLWLEQQVGCLRSHRLDTLDINGLAEELEDMGRSEKRTVRNTITIVLMHLLKYEFQPSQRSKSWEATLIEHRLRIRDLFEDSPSLKRYAESPEVVQRCYDDACKRASRETGLAESVFPKDCPYSLEQVLSETFLPE